MGSFLRIVSVFLSPIMPAFVLANYAYYEEEAHSLRRDLQTLGTKKCSLCKMMSRTFSSKDGTRKDICSEKNNETYVKVTCKNEELKIENSDVRLVTHSTDNNEQDNKNEEKHRIWMKNRKIELFKDISKVTLEARHFRRIYSFYRIVHATIEAYCVIAILVLMLIVSNKDEKSQKFLNVFAGKISIFVELQTAQHSSESRVSFLESLNLVNQVTIWGSILYSGLMLLTALERYVYQSKSKNISKCGQLILVLYFLCHVITRLTNTIAIYTTAEYIKEINNPIVTRYTAAMILSVIFMIHYGAIYYYKSTIQEFRERTNIIERLVHVLANTVVVIPFMTWDTKGPSNVDEWKFCSDNNCQKPKRTGSLDKLMQMKEIKTIGHRKTFSTGHIPDMESVIKVIEKVWWKNPTRTLMITDVKKEFSCYGQNDMTSEIIVKSFEYLESAGFINKQLYNPRRTKKEYVILFALQVSINLVAICIELINGGVKTEKGKYVAWDIRILAFCVGIVFLCSYYKKFHILKDLTRVHLCKTDGRSCQFFCCFREGNPMHAIPDYDTMQRCLTPPNLEIVTKRTIHTQTSEGVFESLKSSPKDIDVSSPNEHNTVQKNNISVSQLFKKFSNTIKRGVSLTSVNFNSKTTNTPNQSGTVISEQCDQSKAVENEHFNDATNKY